MFLMSRVEGAYETEKTDAPKREDAPEGDVRVLDGCEKEKTYAPTRENALVGEEISKNEMVKEKETHASEQENLFTYFCKDKKR